MKSTDILGVHTAHTAHNLAPNLCC